MKKATLKQIAELAGVSLTTVHRALNGKGGCSLEVEERIQRIAEEQGYTTNWAASALRKQPMQIAMIFPFRDKGGRFGLDQILDGYLDFRREAKDYNIIFQEFLLRSSEIKKEDYLDMEYPELEKALTQIYNEQPNRFDGVIVYGMSITRKAEALLNRIVGKGTMVVVMERTLPYMEDFCTVKADMELTGRVAAEILCGQIRSPGTVAVIGKKLPGGDPSEHSFADALREEREDLACKCLHLVMNVNQGEQIAEFLKQIPNLVGIYSTSGRHTASLLNAMEILKLKNVPVIGTELFEESYQALKTGVLTAVMDNRPQKIGYMAVDILVNALGKKKKLPMVYYVPSRIVLRSNCDAYYEERKYRHVPEQYSD